MDKGRISVSVIIPIYNGAGHLKECLESVINQTLKDIEIICIDDGSTDDSAIILAQYEKKYPDKLSVFHTENQGVWRARELGIEKACGMYVGFVDCDDQVKNDIYEKMYIYAMTNQVEMAVTAYQRIVETDRKHKITVEMNAWGNTVWEVGDEFCKFPFLNTALWNKIILREIALKHIKFEYPPRVAEDALFLISIYPYIHRVVFSAIPMYSYYVRSDTAMSYVGIDETDNILESFAKARKYVNDITDDERWDSVMEIAAYIHLGTSLLLRCRLAESREYIRKVKKFLKKEGFGRNIYIHGFRQKEFLKVKLVKIMYSTELIILVPYLKKYVIRLIKW